MTELINIIASKPSWEKKILDATIVKNWKKELAEQNVNHCVLDLVIELLKKYSNKKDQVYDDLDDTYKWVLDINVDPKEYSIQPECNCTCKICEGEEYMDDDEYYDDEDEDKEDEPKRNKEIVCKCTEQDLIDKKMSFLLKYIVKSEEYVDENTDEVFKTGQYHVDNITKKIFKSHILKLKETIPVDYHPGSKNQIIDLVHPSLYCYSKGITKTGKKVDENVLFQWLPADVKIDNGKAYIKSYINNLDPIKDLDLYVSITKIFEKFVPGFESVLQTLFANKRIATCPPLTNCQIIVKIAETIVTPKSPISPPSSWHLEGLPCEKIVATGIYYYEMSNITTNYLKFRTTVDNVLNIEYPQSCPKYVKKHYGFDDDKSLNFDDRDTIRTHDDSTIVELGEIETKEDMLLIFPNFLQHQVSNFTLADKRRPGYRKILVFFLVDPSTPILSTSSVKPQQSTMSLKDAKILRELLMFERKYEISDQNAFFERGWSLCEH